MYQFAYVVAWVYSRPSEIPEFGNELVFLKAPTMENHPDSNQQGALSQWQDIEDIRAQIPKLPRESIKILNIWRLQGNDKTS